ncbi:hypothetical protein DFH07DRAFT_1014284 [Mycena maculata]|uniref:MYND-type domain-containing protein n=1 Tax=Mycena maculata TaxID=230809 RepID=A0AAD7JLL8_9AGAR|nr:hypothetical protein DFH07DRAFT_1014284 [Mycena maculata]
MELESINYLLKSLRDPMGTPCCAKVLYLGSGMLTPHEPDLMARDELACDRSEQEQVSLKHKLSTCRCDLHDPAVARLHLGDTPVPPPNNPSPTDLDNALTLMCTILSDLEGLSTLHVGKFRKVRKNATADKQPWPNSEDEVLQSSNGAKGTVGSLLRWAAALPNGYAIFMAIGAIARFWEPFAREILRTPRTFSLATDNMQIALDRYDADMPPYAFSKKFYLPLVSCGQAFFLKLGSVSKQMMMITFKIQPILRAPGPSAEGIRTWFDQMQLTMEEASSIVAKDRGIPDVNFSKGAGSYLLRQLISPQPKPMHLECMEALGVKTMACDGCGIVRYCSRECQTPAWRASNLPHKGLCKAIQSLRTVLQLNKTEWAKWMVQTMDKDELTPARREPLFEMLCRSKKVSAELTLSIENGASALKEAKRAQLDELERNRQ